MKILFINFQTKNNFGKGTENHIGMKKNIVLKY
jgi:hypothetical protein